MVGNTYDDSQCFVHQTCQSSQNAVGISKARIRESRYVFNYAKFICLLKCLIRFTMWMDPLNARRSAQKQCRLNGNIFLKWQSLPLHKPWLAYRWEPADFMSYPFYAGCQYRVQGSEVQG
jgi:hypothetical protein